MDRFIPTAVSSEKYAIFLNESQKKPGLMRNNIVDNYQEEQNQNTYQNLLQSQILGESPTNENEKLDKWNSSSLSGKKKKNKVFKFN